MIIVKFLQRHSKWVPDETAGFPDKIAQRLIKAGVAELVSKKKPLEDVKDTKLVKPRPGRNKEYETK